MSRLGAALALAAVAGALGCGARTGLDAPAGADGAADAGADAAGPDRRDAGADAGGVARAPLCRGADLTVRYGSGVAEPARVSLRATVRIPQADVYFLFDTTGSMTGEIAAMRAAMIELMDALACPSGGRACSDERDCRDGERCSPEGRCGPAPEVAGCLPDLQVGVGRYAGAADSYRHLLDVGPVTAATVDAIPRFADGPGGNESLYQSVTCVVGRARCPSAGCYRGERRACPGFRERSLPIVVTLTDEGDECLRARLPERCGATHVDAGAAARALGAVLVGVDADARDMEATPYLVAIAEEAGAYGPDGSPLVFQGGEGDVVAAVRDGLSTVAASPLPLYVELVDLDEADGISVIDVVDHVAVDTTSRGCFPYRDLEDRSGDGRLDAVVAAGPGTAGCFELFPRRTARLEGPIEVRVRARVRAGGAVVATQDVCFAIE